MIFKRIALRVLKRGLGRLASLTDAEIKDLTKKINAKVDIPKLDEKQEARLISETLHTAVSTAQAVIEVLQ